MKDKRHFLYLLNSVKEVYPDHKGLVESIEEKFNEEYPTITDRERKALRTFPIQYIKRIPQESGEWTSQLHIWAEEGVRDILDLDPIILSFKNSYGDTVLMSLLSGATGSITDVPDYELIKKALDKDYSYTTTSKKDDQEIEEEKNVLNDLDSSGQSPIDYLIDCAYAKGEYSSEDPDPTLQGILDAFAGSEHPEE